MNKNKSHFNQEEDLTSLNDYEKRVYLESKNSPSNNNRNKKIEASSIAFKVGIIIISALLIVGGIILYFVNRK